MKAMVTASDNGNTGELGPLSPRVIAPNAMQTAWLNLRERRQFGHMGSFEYANGGMGKWEKFLAEHPEYYIPGEEQAIIERCAHMSARLIEAGKKVTIVSRGPGTKFAAKEGVLIRAFMVAGVDIAKVVYIDFSKQALNRSVREGRVLLPNAQHQIAQADIFASETKNEYKVIGTEVSTCFGLTPMNVEGHPESDLPPISAVEANFRGINAQQKKGSHFIATYDHNEDAKSIEAAYRGQSEFALHMLELDKHLGMNTSHVDFGVQYFPKSRILGHYFEFQKDVKYQMAGRQMTEVKGTKLWFNNSVKLSSDQVREAYTHTGFGYVELDEGNPIMADNGNFGYHHVQKLAA